MRFNRRFAHFLALLGLPVLVALFDFSVLTAAVLLLLWLVVGWVMTLAAFRSTPKDKLILNTIPPSHFAEKVRWCLDRCGVEYVEHTDGATLGAFYTGRTVPRLRFFTGRVWSSIGNSEEILRYVWGQYGSVLGDQGAFLAATEEHLALERRLETYGRQLQLWIYAHALDERDFMLHVWGANDPAVPPVQRTLLKVLYPWQVVLMRKAFALDTTTLQRCTPRIEALLQELDEHLAQHHTLVGDQRSYVDYTLASLSALWINVEQFGNGVADGIKLSSDQYPQSVIEDQDRWSKQFPHVVSFVRELYLTERQPLAQ